MGTAARGYLRTSAIVTTVRRLGHTVMIRSRLTPRGGSSASVAAIVLSLFVALLAFTAASPWAWASSTVGVVKIDHTPSDAEVEQMVRDAVALAGGLPVQPGDHVVVKPNLVETNWPSGGGVVTDVRVLRAVVKMALEAAALGDSSGSVTIAEGSAGFRGFTPPVGWQALPFPRYATKLAVQDVGLDVTGPGGQPDMHDDYDYDILPNFDGPNQVPIIDMNDVGGWYSDYTGGGSYNLSYVTPVTVADALYPKHNPYWTPIVVLPPAAGGTCDVLISVPTLKNHGNAGFTSALKNRVGTAPSDIYHAPSSWTWNDFVKYQMKWLLVHAHGGTDEPSTENEAVDRSIADLNMARPNDFAVVDGLVGITDGPTGGTPKSPPMRLIMAADDSVAVDTVGTLVIGYKPTSIQYLSHLATRGFGLDDTTFIDVLGSRVSQVRSDFPLPYSDLIDPDDRAESTPPNAFDFIPSDGSSVDGIVTVQSGTITDNVGVAKVEFYVDGTLRSVDRSGPPWSWSWNTEGETSGAHTVELIAYDAALNDRTNTNIVYVGPTTVTSPLLAAGWQMISVPIEPDDPTPTAVFRDPVGDPIPILDQLYRWDPVLKRYRVYTTGDADGFGNVSIGIGMWLYLSEAKQIQYSGSPAAGSVNVPLSLGGTWHMMGQPHNGATLLTSCTVTDAGPPQTSLPFADAVNAGWLYTPLYCWDVSLGGYQRCGLDPWDATDGLGAWMGYWAYVAPGHDLTLTVPSP